VIEENLEDCRALVFLMGFRVRDGSLRNSVY
jgi:hypothetical protein